jgi:hypothetical protein
MRDADPNPVPVPVIPLDYADPAPDRRRRFLLRWSRRAAALALFVCAAAWVALRFVKVESVLITGPILFVLGVLTLVGGVITGHRLFTGLGAMHCAVCVLFVTLVNTQRWSPRDAREPFTWMGLAYTAAVTAPTLLACMKRDLADHS